MASSVENTTNPYHQHSHHHQTHAGGSDAHDVFASFMERFRSHANFTNISGGDGDDTINSTAGDANIDGGSGNDTINAHGGRLNIDGGGGDDTINATSLPVFSSLHLAHCGPHYVHFHPVCHTALLHIAELNGGAGNDTIEGRGLMRIDGGEGDDVIKGHGGLLSVNGGSGNDTIYTGGGSTTVNGGAGDDYIDTGSSPININGYINGGAGDDTLDVSGKSMRVMGGTGDDTLNLNLSGFDTYGGLPPHSIFGASRVTAGIGNDTLNFESGWAQIDYFVGDGHDVIEGADELSTLNLGEGLSAETTTFSIDGNDLVLTFPDADGSITFKNYNTQGLPTIQYADGRVLDASTTLAYAGGDPDAYAVSEQAAASEAKAADDDGGEGGGKDKAKDDHAKDHDD